MFAVMRELSLRAGVVAGPVSLSWHEENEPMSAEITDSTKIPDEFLTGGGSMIQHVSPLHESPCWGDGKGSDSDSDKDKGKDFKS